MDDQLNITNIDASDSTMTSNMSVQHNQLNNGNSLIYTESMMKKGKNIWMSTLDMTKGVLYIDGMYLKFVSESKDLLLNMSINEVSKVIQQSTAIYIFHKSDVYMFVSPNHLDATLAVGIGGIVGIFVHKKCLKNTLCHNLVRKYKGATLA